MGYIYNNFIAIIVYWGKKLLVSNGVNIKYFKYLSLVFTI